MKRPVFLMLGAAVLLTAASVNATLHFAEDDFIFSKVDGYDVVTLKEGTALNQIGSPQLPKKSLYFLIPANAEIVGVRIIDQTDENLPGVFKILPAQRPFPLSAPQVFRFTAPDDRVYSRAQPYPEQSLRFYPSGVKAGFRIAGVDVCPLKYFPADGRLILTRSLTIAVEYRENAHAAASLTARQQAVFASEVKSLVSNPQDLARFAPAVSRELDEVNFVIITSDAYAPSFAPLAEWRTRQGWMTEIKTTTSIYAGYSGYDNQEKIRNFIKDYFANKGLVWVLLGGDVNIVPVREAYLPYYGDSYVATDLYYSDLDGTWDADGDHRWGEMVVDGVDLFVDVMVGRIPAGSTANIDNYIAKQTVYEKSPPAAYLKKILLPSVQLFSNGWHGREVNNAIADSTPAGWLDTKLENPPLGRIRDSLNTGYQFCHPAAHGDENGFYNMSGGPIFNIGQVSALTNGANFTIMNSIACYAGDFDEYDCIAESLVNKYPGACVAAILNTRYGWGDWSGFGFSEKIDMKFYGHFFNRDTLQIGRCHGRSKDSFRSDGLVDTVARYCLCELTLFSDPALPMWENTPVALTAAHPASIPPTSQDVTVNVAAGGSPVAGALVCLYKTGEVHKTGHTDAAGDVVLTVAPATVGPLSVTATAKDHLPYEGVIQVVDAGMPATPVLVAPFDYIRLPDFKPTLAFSSTDPQGDSVLYRVLWDTDHAFATPESCTTGFYPSGEIVSFVFPADLAPVTYWWTVKCCDNSGSGYWTGCAGGRSLTVDTTLDAQTCTWFQTTGAQFGSAVFNNTVVAGDSVLLVAGQTSGSVTGTAVDYQNLSGVYPRSKWGNMIWRKATAGDSVGIRIEYNNGTVWQPVEDAVLPGNSTGFFTAGTGDTIDLAGLDTVTYRDLRLRGLLVRKARTPNNPALLDWEVGNLNYTGVAESKVAAMLTGLGLFPNPFTNALQIRYTLDSEAAETGVEIAIYDVAGRLLVREHMSAKACEPATTTWNGRDRSGRPVAAGVYFVRIEVGGENHIIKAVLLR